MDVETSTWGGSSDIDMGDMVSYAIFNATKYVCHWDPTFAAYLAKKRAEGKHYNVAISHAAKKLVRLIYALEKSREPYRSAA